MSTVLNHYHGTTYSTAQWRVVSGPWLSYFLTILYDRRISVTNAYDQYRIKNVYILERKNRLQYVPENMDNFIECMVTDDWNEMIFADIIKYYDHPHTLITNTFPIDCRDKGLTKNKVFKIRQLYLKLKPSIRNFIDVSIALIANKTQKRETIFLMRSYLGIIDEILIQLRCRQVPRFPIPYKFNFIPPNRKDRVKLTEIIADFIKIRKDVNDFESLFWKILPNYLPSAYIESFKAINHEIDERCIWPKEIKYIVNTGAMWNNDDFFKIWCMRKIKEGAKLIIGQHGGNYGIADLNFNETHQIKISHKFLSWGWKVDEHKNVVPFGIISPSSKHQIKPRQSGDFLLILTPMPRYSYSLLSAPIGSDNYNAYMEQQFEFYRSLPSEISKKVVIRLFKNPKLDYGHNIARRWLEKFPNVKIDYGKRSLASQLNKSAIGISTYNATSFLETLSMNFPTLIYWDDSLWKTNEKAKISLDLLENVGIYHPTASSASRFLGLISSDILGWWYSNRVQEARAKFCFEYARHPRQNLLSILD